MMRQALATRPVGFLVNFLILCLILVAIVLVGNGMQRNDALQQRIDDLSAQQDQWRTMQQRRLDTGWSRFASKHPDLLPQLDRLAKLLGPKDYLMSVQLDESGALRLQMSVEKLDQAFVFVDRLRANGYPAVIQQATQTGGFAMLVNIGVESKQQ